ncbi:hypothetical protein [Marinibaculum pumilum]
MMLLSVLLLAGCGTSVPPEEQARRMAGACQTRFCTCQQEDVGILTRIKKAPVQWRLNGDAYCQEGYTLKFDEPPKSSLSPW